MLRLPFAKLSPVFMCLMLMVALTGCGHTQQVGSDHTLSVALTEYRLNPESARVASGPLTLVVRNFGRLTHNLVISMNGQPTASTRPLAPGESAAITVDLAAGSYHMASTILSDQALGEYGTLTVTR
ncbi:MAG: cupredoxin domain-containing protein [Solirubrobacteraceae bacterium]